MKKVLSILLVLVLMMSALPALPMLTASADDTVELRNYTNIAYQKPVMTGRDTAFQTGSYVTNGNTSETGVDIPWRSNGEMNPECYVIVDLEDVYTVNGVTVQNHVGSRHYHWEAYASTDLNSWTLIARKCSDAPSIAGGYYHETDETEARYIKVVGTYDSANDGYHFGEVEVYSPNVYTTGTTAAATYVGNGYTGTLDETGTLTVAASNTTAQAVSAAPGTAENPYLIATAEDFKALTDSFNASTSESDAYGTGLFFRQTADIDMTGVEGYEGTHAGDSSVGKRYFGGVYDGGGHTLTVALNTTGQTSIFPYITGSILNLKINGSITATNHAQPIRTVQSAAVVANCVFDMTLNAGTGTACGVTYTCYGTMFNVFSQGVAKKALYNTNSSGHYYHVFTNVVDANGAAATHSTATATSDLDVIAAAFNDRSDSAFTSRMAKLKANCSALTESALGEASVANGELVLSGGTLVEDDGGNTPADPVDPAEVYGKVGGASSNRSDYPWNAVRSNIRKVVLESDVTSVGAYAFANCPNLRTLVIKGAATLEENALANTELTKMVTVGKYYTDYFADVQGTSNETPVRRALTNVNGGVQWKTLEDDSILYVYGCGALSYSSRDNVPWFAATDIRGKYEKVVVGDAITDIGMYSFSADAYGRLAEIVLGASMQQFKYQSMAYIPLARLTFLAPITYYGHYTTTGNKCADTLGVTLASGQTSADLISKMDSYNGTAANGNDKLWEANFTSVDKKHVEWIDTTTGKAVFACYVAEGQTPVFGEDNVFVLDGVTYEFDIPTTEPVTQDTTYTVTSRALVDYHITWVKEGTTEVLYESDVASGLVPEYNGITTYEENGYVYVANVPTAVPATADTTYEVPFTQLSKYTIRWIDGHDGSVIYEENVCETLTPVFGGTLPEAYTEDDVTYTPVLPPVKVVTGAADYTVYYYADYDTANYPDIYPSGISYKLLDEETLYIYGTGPIPTYESSGGADAPWAQYRETVKKIIVSDGITEIGSCALRDYTALEEIVLGKDVRKFNYAAFAIDYQLDKITFLGNITYYGHQCFSGMSKTLVVTQASGQTHQSLKDAQAYGGTVAYGNNQLFNVTEENYHMVPRIVARFVDGHTGETLFITSLASGTTPYFPVDLPASYTENGVTYNPVMPELSAITESTTYTIAYEAEQTFEDGDIDGNGSVDITDVTALINVLGGGSTAGLIEAMLDVDKNGELLISDVTALLDLLAAL